MAFLSLLRRARARKVSEYYVKAKYGYPAYPLLDALRQIASIGWYALLWDRQRLYSALGRLHGIVTVLATPAPTMPIASVGLAAAPDDQPAAGAPK